MYEARQHYDVSIYSKTTAPGLEDLRLTTQLGVRFLYTLAAVDVGDLNTNKAVRRIDTLIHISSGQVFDSRFTKSRDTTREVFKDYTTLSKNTTERCSLQQSATGVTCDERGIKPS